VTADSVLEWLLDSDPSIRWQVRRDVLGESDSAVVTDRKRVATEGWGARLLDLQDSDGNWAGGAWIFNNWTSTFETLMMLREMGIDATNHSVRNSINSVAASSNWGEWHNHSPFFEGESEPCINGRVLALGSYFGHTSEKLVGRLLDEQLPDGGWNCDAPGSQRSSFNTTICVLEGLLENETKVDSKSDVNTARLRGQEFLLERKLFKSLTTGKAIERDRKSGRDWRNFTFPTRWYYDILWGLDYLRKARAIADERTSEALEIVRGTRLPNGRWPLGEPHPGQVHFQMDAPGEKASRWNTLRALRVLKWSDNAESKHKG